MMYCYSVHEKFIAMKNFCRSSKEYYGAIMLDVKSNLLKTNMQEELPKISTCKAQFIHESMVYFHYKRWWDRLIKDMVGLPHEWWLYRKLGSMTLMKNMKTVLMTWINGKTQHLKMSVFAGTDASSLCTISTAFALNRNLKTEVFIS